MDLKSESLLIDLIEKGYECEYLDFKAIQYDRSKHPDLLKDVMAMANSNYSGAKYIIIGIKLRPDGEREVIGIDETSFTDSAIYEQLVLNNIEPNINVNYFPFHYKEKLLGVLRINDTGNKPYIIKKDYQTLRKGLCLVRNGSHQVAAVRNDFDNFYSQKEAFEMIILDPYFYVTDNNEGCGILNITIRNLTNNPVTLNCGTLLIIDSSDNKRSQHRVFGLNKCVGADFTLPLTPKSEQTGYLHLNFESSDCLRLGLDVYGTTEERFKFKLIMSDTMGNDYTAEADNGCIFAKGNVLWKVHKHHKFNSKRKRLLF